MADAIIRAKQDDMIDLLVWKKYGKQSGYVEAVLDSPKNWRLCDEPELLAAGTPVVMPTLQIVDPAIKLWDDA